MNEYYAEYKQHNADTGRLSGDFQQVPRVMEGRPNLRDAVRAPAGMSLLEADGSQIELRLIAWRAREHTLLRLYQEGADVHSFSGRLLFGLPEGESIPKIVRQTGKTCNFGLGYEAGDEKLAEIMLLNLKEADIKRVCDLLGAVSLQDAASTLHRRWHETFPGIRQWHAREKALILKQGGKAIAPHGRIKHLPLVFSKDFKQRAEAFRDGVNHVIQSPASDLVMLAAVMATPIMYAKCGAVAGPWLFHDSLLFLMNSEHPVDGATVLKRVMERDAVKAFEQHFNLTLDIPILADLKLGSSWGALKEWTL